MLFNELCVPLAWLPPPPAQGCALFSQTVSDGRVRHWSKGFGEYLSIFSRSEASWVVKSQQPQLAQHGKLEPRSCSVLFAKKICLKGILNYVPALLVSLLWFSRKLREGQTLLS